MDPEKFDLTGWLAEAGDDLSARPHAAVTVYRHTTEIDKAVAEVKALEAQTGPGSDEAIGDTGGAKALDEARARVSALVAEHGVTVDLYAPTRPELRAIGKDHDPAEPEYTYQVLARFGRVQGTTLDPDGWERLHTVIGQAQFDRIQQAMTASMSKAPEVDAVFSHGS